MIFENLFATRDLLCASLVNHGWRTACVDMNKLWRRHWQLVKLSATERRRILAKNPNEVDWYAESESAIRKEVGLTLLSVCRRPKRCSLEERQDVLPHYPTPLRLLCSELRRWRCSSDSLQALR